MTVASADEGRIGFAICDPGLSFGAIVGLGAKERAAELGVELSVVSVSTPQAQADVIARFVHEPVAALIVEAVESRIVLPALQSAGPAGIPIVIADMGIRGAQAACTVRSDNVKGGELAAEYLVSRLQGAGLIAHLQGLLTSDNGVDRSRGFHNVVDRHSEIEVVEVSSGWTSDAGAAVMRDLIAENPLLRAVFANNDPLALGAIAAIEEAGRTGDIIVAGFDALPDALLAIQRGTMDATVRQMPREMGRLALELSVRLVRGETVPPAVQTEVALVTEESIAEASLATLPLFPRVLRDLTESSVALAEERSLLRTLIDHLPDSIYVKELDGRFALVNSAGLRHLGVDKPEEAVGKTDFDFFPEELAAHYRADEQAIIESGEPLLSHEERTVDAAGNMRWFSTSKVPVRDGSGNIVGLVGMNRDITERKLADELRQKAAQERELLEAELRQAQKLEAVGRLAGGVAHDFNNLLTAILGYSDLILQRMANSESPIRRDAEEIKSAAEKAEALTRHLLAFSRRRGIETQSVDLNEVVSDMDRLLRRLIGADVEFVTVLTPEPARVDGDRSQLEQVLVNFVVNARDAMPEGGKLVIETQKTELAGSGGPRGLAPGRYVVLSVRDSGVGMDSATQARIFEPFFTTKEVGEGTGLGLSSVWGIVEQAGGRVLVESGLGAGTAFTIHLPESRRPSVVVSEPPPPVTSLRGSERVLLVEDEEMIRALCARTLAEHGYQVVEAPYASAALEHWHGDEERFDVLVSDVVMPGMSGIELGERVLADRPRTAVVLMSGYTDTVALDRLEGAAVSFLEKPFTQTELLRTIRTTLGRVDELRAGVV